MGILPLYLLRFPARRLLQSAGIEPVCVSDFDESQIQLSDPASLVQTLAQRKAETVAAQFESALILGCDSLCLSMVRFMANHLTQSRRSLVGKDEVK